MSTAKSSHPSLIPHDDIHGYLQTAISLARRAGNLIHQLRYPAQAKELDIETKQGSADLVTNADIASQSLIFSALRELYPNHKFIGEEDSVKSQLTNQPTWIVDAIDGTTNFVHGLESCVSVGFVVDRKPVAGAIYNPSRREMFHAAQGRGAFMNDLPIAVKKCDTLQSALVLTEWGYIRDPHAVRKMISANERLIIANVRGIRQLGAGALDLCYVAMGRADAVYCGVAGEGWHPWDFAAGVIIAREAGASITKLDGSPFDLEVRSMACATSNILPQLLQVVNAE